MTTFTVTTAADVVDTGDGALSLREAVARANTTEAADTILFAGALQGRTLTLTQGQLSLAADVTIDGDRDDDGSRVTIDADGGGRVFAVTGTGTDASLTGLGVTGGYTTDRGGGGILVGAGNALALSGCTVSGNRAGYHGVSREGGGLLAEAGSRLTVDRSDFTGNQAAAGGAIAAIDAAAVTLSRSTVSGNGGAEFGRGGGLWLEGVAGAEIERCTIAGNRAYYGAGICLRGGSALIRASTIAGNVGGADFDARGTGILTTGALVLLDSTVTGNRSLDSLTGYGAGIGIDAGGSLVIANSIVAGNFAQPPESSELLADDIAGRLVASNGHNVFGSAVDGNAPGDLEGVAAARLFAALDPDTGGGRLALNGGPTPTVRLRDARNNPALSGADPLDAAPVDQRGVNRPQPEFSNPDVGSFELDQRQVSRSPSPNNDVLAGTAGDDTLTALAGRDLVRGLAGRDALRGLAGSDTLDGGPGGDLVDGGAGSDLLWGRADADRLLGGSGLDRVFGGSGADLIRGGGQRDRIAGGPGDDIFAFLESHTGRGAARDIVRDFRDTPGDNDVLDLAAIDANKNAGGNQAFRFGGQDSTPELREVSWFRSGADTIVAFNDGRQVGQIELDGVGAAPDAGDFIL